MKKYQKVLASFGVIVTAAFVFALTGPIAQSAQLGSGVASGCANRLTCARQTLNHGGPNNPVFWGEFSVVIASPRTGTARAQIIIGIPGTNITANSFVVSGRNGVTARTPANIPSSAGNAQILAFGSGVTLD